MNQSSDQIRERALMMLRRFYGYSSFRPMQYEIIQSIMEGHDTIVLMPTGGGKSITFQIPSLIMDGCTIVVTPLIALMHDQVAALCANGIPAATVNSNQSEHDNAQVMQALYSGKLKLLYISPERLISDMPRWHKDIRINFVAIDEAHCISRWGHDFRPVYTRLSEIRAMRPELPMMALTATADKLCRDDIAAQLMMRNPKKFVSSFDRPNLDLTVMTNPGPKQRLRQIAALIERHPADAGIVYCLSRKGAESTDLALRNMGYRSAVYHAGLSPEQRTRAQQLFKAGQLQVVCATVAFGMGIDKSNIRWVVHNNMPSNIESYYQEIGRAGRDGLPARAVMFYSFADIIALRNFAMESGQSDINLEKLKRMQQFAEASICRRRILLSYFGETVTHDCGHCDVCRSAPARYDASTPVKMALSAIIRCNQMVGSSMLVDVLRGSLRADIREKGFDKIKTFGVGRDLSVAQWQAILLQMLQLGLIEIAYNRGSHISVTEYGMKALYSTEPIMLPHVDNTPLYGNQRKKAAPKPVLSPFEKLLGDLKAARGELAVKLNTPADLILSDPVLHTIAKTCPTDFASFVAIEGIGDKKAARYHNKFLRVVANHQGRKYTPTPTHIVTHYLLTAGHDIGQIAALRDIKPSTVYSHIATLIDADMLAPANALVTRGQYQLFLDARAADPEHYIDKLNDRLPQGMLSVMLAIERYRERHGGK